MNVGFPDTEWGSGGQWVSRTYYNAEESNPKESNSSDTAKQRALFFSSNKAKLNPKHPLPRPFIFLSKYFALNRVESQLS